MSFFRKLTAVAALAMLALPCVDARAQLVTQTLNAGDPGLTQGTFQISSGNLFSTAQLTGSGQTYNFVASFFTAAATQSYKFGQTSAPVDTVLILYNGVFDPSSPGTGALVLNDDTSVANHAAAGATASSCGGAASLCPQVTQSLTNGQQVTLVITTFSAGASLGLPQAFYANGPGTFSASAGGGGGGGSGDIVAPVSASALTGTERFDGGTLTLDQNVTGNIAITNNGGTLSSATARTFSGNLTNDTGAVGAMTVTGGGTVSLTGVNT